MWILSGKSGKEKRKETPPPSPLQKARGVKIALDQWWNRKASPSPSKGGDVPSGSFRGGGLKGGLNKIRGCAKKHLQLDTSS